MKTGNARVALLTLAVLALIGTAFAQLGSGDPPIIIGDGSLVLTSPRARWADWAPESSSERRFPAEELGIAGLRIESPDNNATVDLSGRRTVVSITSASATVDVITLANGRAIRVRLRGRRFADFQSSEDGRTLTLPSSGSISAIHVQRAGQTVLQLRDLKPATKLTFLPAE